MTIKDLDTETLIFNKLYKNLHIKDCPSKDCPDCQLRELCYFFNSYDNDVRKELASRKQDEHNG